MEMAIIPLPVFEMREVFFDVQLFIDCIVIELGVRYHLIPLIRLIYVNMHKID